MSPSRLSVLPSRVEQQRRVLLKVYGRCAPQPGRMAATINLWVNAVLRFAVVAALISSAILPAAARKKPRGESATNKTSKPPSVSRSFLIAQTLVPASWMDTMVISLGRRWRSTGFLVENNRNSHLHRSNRKATSRLTSMVSILPA